MPRARMLPCLVLPLLLPAALAAQVPTFTVAVRGAALSGTPLEATVEVGGWTPGRTLRAYAFIDGKKVAEPMLEGGSTWFRVDTVELAVGRHHLMVRSGTTVAETDFLLLPGWLALVPPLLALGLLALTRQLLLSLALAVLSGAWILARGHPLVAVERALDHFLVPTLADPGRIALLLAVALFGGMMGVVARSGGAAGVAERLARRCRDRRGAQLAAWAMGLAVFFDPFTSPLLVGTTLRPLADRLRVSREKLAYVADTTAAPLASLLPLSTWMAFEVALLGGAISRLHLQIDASDLFLASLPYRFYPAFALLLGLALAVCRHDFGAMRRAEEGAAAGDARAGEGALLAVAPGVPPAPARARNALLPVAALAATAFVGICRSGLGGGPAGATAAAGLFGRLRHAFIAADVPGALLWAALAGGLVAVALPLAQRAMTARQALAAWTEGGRSVFLLVALLSLAWSLAAVCGELHTLDFLAGWLGGVSPLWMPPLAFLLAAVGALVTGSSWGTVAAVEPLALALFHRLVTEQGVTGGHPLYGTVLFGGLAAVVAGAVLGEHGSPFAPTTILAAAAAGCAPLAHVRTQLPYVLAPAAVALLVGVVPAAHGMPPWACWMVGATVIVGGVLGLTRRR